MRVAAFDIGIVNLVYVVIETAPPPHDFAILHWKQMGIGTSTSPCDRLVESLTSTTLANMTDFNGVDAIVIERQMSLKMCVLAHVLQTIFIVHGKNVVMQHATRKNQCGSWLGSHGMPFSATERTDYRTYKKRAVQDALQCLLVQGDPYWVTMFNGMKKQDDYADALLHAVWWLLIRSI